MTQIIHNHTVPFLLLAFATHGIPEVHMYTNFNEKLVFRYSQTSEDQTARDDGVLSETPRNTLWNFASVVITDTDRWNVRAFDDVLGLMRRGGTGFTYILLRDTQHVCFNVIRGYVIKPAYRIRPLGFENVELSKLPVILIVGTIYSGHRGELNVQDYHDLTDLKDLLRLKYKTPDDSGFHVYDDILPTLPQHQWKGSPQWWVQFSSEGQSPLVFTTLSENEMLGYMRPRWRSKWTYDENDIPSLNSIRSPAVQRAEQEEPLPTAPTDTFSKMVWRKSIEPNPEIFRIVSGVRIADIVRLTRDFPNQSYIASWKKVFEEGLWPWADNFETDDESMRIYRTPQHMFLRYNSFVNKIRDKEVGFQHWRGPFPALLPYGRNSPWSVVPKPEGGNRFIQDQSFSIPRGDGINDHIPVAEGNIEYDSLDNLAMVIVILHKQGRMNMVPWKIDVARAFRHLPLHPLFTLRNAVVLKSRKGADQFYYDSQACFGGRAFPRAYCMFAGLVVWIAVVVFGCSILFHFVDDHYGISEIDIEGEEPRDMRILRRVFRILGIPTNEKAEFGNGTVITGVEVNFDAATFRFPERKLIKYISTCACLAKQTVMTKKDLEHIGGVLDYCLMILPQGKIHNVSIYKAKGEHFNAPKTREIPNTKEMRESLSWWANSLARSPIRHLLDNKWWTYMDADEIHFRRYTRESRSLSPGVP